MCRSLFFLAIDSPYEARLAKDLDPFLGEVALLPLASETVLRPLVAKNLWLSPFRKEKKKGSQDPPFPIPSELYASDDLSTR